MTTVLTLCSANYLAHAKTLGQSLLEHNPGFLFVIGLVDRISQGVEAAVRGIEVIPVEDLAIPGFSEMAAKYGVVELNTAVKPFFMEYLYRRDEAVKEVIYLDPDILVFDSLEPLVTKLRNCSIVLTPHSCTYDNSPQNLHYEIAMLSTGIYNLGFIATSRSDTTFTFLRWWQHRLRDYCFNRRGSGMFVDQRWVSLAPLYFDGICIDKNPGYNMSYWNHFERRISSHNGKYVVNGSYPLVFYHFSNYNPLRPEAITNRSSQPTVSFAERPDLLPLYDEYRRRLLKAGYESVRRLEYAFRYKSPPPGSQAGTGWRLSQNVRRLIQGCLRIIVRSIPRALRHRVRRLAQFTARNCAK